MSADESGQKRFLSWARESCVPISGGKPTNYWHDLEPIGAMIGDATIVALGEGDHFAAEPLWFRNRLFQYLVEEKGFTAIALESGSVEGKQVYDFVLGGPGEISDVLARGISWTFDHLPQNVALVEWMRNYNIRNRNSRKLKFYGFDIPGSPSNAKANLGVDTALTRAMEYLKQTDAEAAGKISNGLAGIIKNLRFDPYNYSDAPGYEKLTETERRYLSDTIGTIVSTIEANADRFGARGSEGEYKWAHRAAIGAQQVDTWLRHIPLGWNGAAAQIRFLDQASDWRDKCQADNIEWIVRQASPKEKLLIYAHNAHISAAPVEWTWTPIHSAAKANMPETFSHKAAGTYLRSRYGDDLVIIGNLIGGGRIGSRIYSGTLRQASPNSIDGIIKEVGLPMFMLDIRSMPRGLYDWFNQRRKVTPGFELPDRYEISLAISAGAGFDILLYFDTVTPSCAPHEVS